MHRPATRNYAEPQAGNGRDPCREGWIAVRLETHVAMQLCWAWAGVQVAVRQVAIEAAA